MKSVKQYFNSIMLITPYYFIFKALFIYFILMNVFIYLFI